MNFKRLLVLLLPIFIGQLFEIIFCNFYSYRLFNTIENIFFVLLINAVLTFFKKPQLNKLLTFCSFIFITFFVFFESVYYHIFSSNLSASGMFIVFQTDVSESIEFFKSYITFPIIILFFVYLIILFYYKKIQLLSINKKKESTWINFFIIIFSVAFLITPTLLVQNLPYLIYKANSQYQIELKTYKAFSDKLNKNVFFDTHQEQISEDELHIIVIGESTSREHFSISSNYYRNTTPLLKSIERKLSVFKNVISPEVITTESLKQVLTLSSNSHFKINDNATLVQLLNKVGYKTYWYSNQRTMSKYDTQITSIASACNVFKSVNFETQGLKTPFDGELLPYLDEAINDDTSKKKVVFLHLLGTHKIYENRYPEQFSKFSDSIPLGKFINKKNKGVINNYDNAILYQDYLVYQMILKLEAQQKNSFLLYLPDHGEEVFDTIDFSGHVIDGQKTKNMYEIPFVLWNSKNDIFTYDIDRPFMTDDLIHSVADLLKIKSKTLDSTKSIFSDSFVPKERMIKVNNENISFENFYNKSKSSQIRFIN